MILFYVFVVFIDVIVTTFLIILHISTIWKHWTVKKCANLQFIFIVHILISHKQNRTDDEQASDQFCRGQALLQQKIR